MTKEFEEMKDAVRNAGDGAEDDITKTYYYKDITGNPVGIEAHSRAEAEKKADVYRASGFFPSQGEPVRVVRTAPLPSRSASAPGSSRAWQPTHAERKQTWADLPEMTAAEKKTEAEAAKAPPAKPTSAVDVRSIFAAAKRPAATAPGGSAAFRASAASAKQKAAVEVILRSPAESIAPPTPEQYMLVADDDTHWYVIPVSRREEWEKYKDCDLVPSFEWVVPISDPSALRFTGFALV